MSLDFFFYGTLQNETVLNTLLKRIYPNFEQNDLIVDRQEAQLSDYIRFKVKDQIYPGIVSTQLFSSIYPKSTLSKTVKGKLFRLKNLKGILDILDRYEGVDEGLYKREIVSVETLNQKQSAHVYVFLRTEMITDTEWTNAPYEDLKRTEYLLN